MKTRVDSTASALESRCALSRESRLDVFRLLARGGPDGLTAESVARHCKAPAPTCSFHLRELEKGGLLNCCRHGRSRIYTANFRAIRALLGHLTGHCCSEEECDHGVRRPRRTGNLDRARSRELAGRSRQGSRSRTGVDFLS